MFVVSYSDVRRDVRHVVSLSRSILFSAPVLVAIGFFGFGFNLLVANHGSNMVVHPSYS